MDSKTVLVKQIIKELIDTIELELSKSPSSMEYWCKDGTLIEADVGYVLDWFDEYKLKLRERYGLDEEDNFSRHCREMSDAELYKLYGDYPY